ncbi:MAG: hypothetical protein JOZ78_05490 [Chroococcidiopsidaceae cyanobacterium CP_BM_ER_R8_30]|nr:hypothetical protein [Chroococcidiopsidaceae cyanobacterium CP_BM_ER_R8_30]
MSQDQPNSQPPPAPEPGANKSETSQEQTAQSTNSRAQTFLRAQSIKALRGTIQLLEGILIKLEAEPPATARETSGFWNKLQLGWSGALAKLRSLLPENLSAKLSDTGLTAIIAAIAVLAVWTTSALLSEKPTEVANVPPATSVPTAELTPSPELTAPKVPPATSVPTAELTPLPELTAPAEPQPIEVVPLPSEPVPSSSPTLELTPEQSLIASIQNQVTEITDQYANGLIQSIQANFRGSSLVIKVGDDWYNLKQSQQDKLAARMLERAKELDFSHLEITDPQGILLARSPVVGNDMVILKRQTVIQRGQESGVRG